MNKMKKWLALLAACALVFSLGLPAFAQDGPGGEITAIAAPAAITAPVGTAQESLGLPETLAATAEQAADPAVEVPVASWPARRPKQGTTRRRQGTTPSRRRRRCPRASRWPRASPRPRCW